LKFGLVSAAVVFVAEQVVGDEAEGLHIDHEFPAYTKASFRPGEDILHLIEIALNDGFEIVEADVNTGGVLFLFGYGQRWCGAYLRRR